MLSKNSLKLSFVIFIALLMVYGSVSLPLNVSASKTRLELSSAVTPIKQPITTHTTYEDPFRGINPAKTFFQEGPGPNTNHVLWKRWYLAAQSTGGVFNGKYIAGTCESVHGDQTLLASTGVTWNGRRMNSKLIAYDQETGTIVWSRGLDWDMMTPFTQRGYIMKIDEERFLINNNVYFTANGSEAPYRYPTSLSVYDPETKIGLSSGPSTKYGIGTHRAWDCSDPKGPPTLLWMSTPGETFSSSRRCIGEGKFFCGATYAHEASAWDLQTGEHIWTAPTRAITGIGISYNDGKIFINSISNYILCLDANTGKELWWFQAGSGGYFVYQDPPVGYGKVYLSSRDGYLYCVDENTGELVWKNTPMTPFGNATHPHILAHENEHIICDNKIYGIGASRPPSAAGSFAGCHGVSVFNCLNAHTGELIWECNNWFEAWKPNIADGKIYGSDYIYDRGVFEEDHKIATGEGSWIHCIGSGPTELSITTDKTDLKTGETVKISGQLVDVSPGAIGPVPEGYTEKDLAPAVHVPINITYVGSEGVKKPIAYVKTDSEGKYSCEWAPWVTGGITISADSVGSEAYEAPKDAVTTIGVKSSSSMESILWPALIAAIVVAVALPIVIFVTRKPK